MTKIEILATSPVMYTDVSTRSGYNQRGGNSERYTRVDDDTTDDRARCREDTHMTVLYV